MNNYRMIYEKESNIAGYLGVLIDQDTDNDTIILRQSGLVKNFLSSTS